MTTPISAPTQRRFEGRSAFATIGIALVVFLTSGSVRAEPTCDSVTAARCHVELQDGLTMSYMETGPSDGQAVLLIHGLTDNLRSWSTTMKSLHEIDPELHVMAIDLRGHGQSDMPDPEACAPAPEACFRISDFAGDVVQFMSAKGISSATLAGHSLGSFIVQEIALTHPEMVDHAVLDATAASGKGNVVLEDYVLKEPLEGSWKTALEEEGKTYPRDVYEMTPLDADPNVETWLAQNWVFDPTANPSFIEPYVPETAGVRLGTWIGATKALLDYDNTERLQSLSVPTLVMWGTQDSIFSAADQDTLKAVLGTAATRQGSTFYWKRYGVVPLPASGAQENDIGHNLQWAAFETVAKDIDAFIRTGKPTRDLVRSDPSSDPTTLLVEPGQAVVEELGG